MKYHQRLRELEREAMLNPTEVNNLLEAFKTIFLLMYDREPTAAEIEAERVYLLSQKPENLSDTITAVEQMVYEGRNK